MEYKPIRVIISGGGTGGHIFPAVSIASKLRELNPESDILFVGAEGKMEMEKVPAAGFKIVGLPIVGLQRRFTWANVKNDVQVPFKLVASLIKARRILKEFKPDIAIGVGGYASAPLLRAATRLGIPTLIQEQNGFAGLTNKILGKKVGRICVAYEGMERFFPADKIVLTGNPIRPDIQPATPETKAGPGQEAHPRHRRQPRQRHPQPGDEAMDQRRLSRRRRRGSALAVRPLLQDRCGRLHGRTS
jgi:UDP-N-acetylglucosamine--N-acetylmuramyl-(pentapeptide) pyrophosphoryl-undecaprenol N-acetylglucosamine transferase